jgi:restriction endonuclease Mrr
MAMSDEQAGDKKPRGRPRSGTAMSGAERQAAYRNRRRQSFIRLELDHGDFAGLIEIVREVAARPSPRVIATQKESNAHMAKQFLSQFESRFAEFVATKGYHISPYDFDEYDDLYPPRPD